MTISNDEIERRFAEAAKSAYLTRKNPDRIADIKRSFARIHSPASFTIEQTAAIIDLLVLANEEAYYRGKNAGWDDGQRSAVKVGGLIDPDNPNDFYRLQKAE